MKPKLTVPEQIDHLKMKGVTFERCSEEEAALILATKNNYFRIASYLVLFPKHGEGPRSGKYMALDFGDLVALSYLDQDFRSLLRSMALDVEHYEKVAILERITEDPAEDGYGIVRDYVAQMGGENRAYLEREMASREHDPYKGELVRRYWPDMPVWVFFEVASFGQFVNFCLFCSSRWDDRRLRNYHFMLKRAKSIRNATAHGSCIINRFESSKSGPGRLNDSIARALGRSPIDNRTWRRRTRNGPMRDVLTLLWLYADLVPAGRSRAETLEELKGIMGETAHLASVISETSRPLASMEFIFRAGEAFGLV